MERSALLLHYGTCITFCHYNLHTNIDKVSTDTIVIMSDSVKFCFNESTAQLGANQVIVALPAGLIIMHMQTFPLCTLTQHPNSIIISGS